ncbi:MAG: response regulator [Bdellovibrionales bacterium]|nr:response regulator [Bdellovibrionales bacterium]
MNSARILLVEDDPISALDVKQTLLSDGHEIVGVASSGQQALELAHSLEPEVILMDVDLGGPLDGIGVAARLREIMAIPIIYLTAYCDGATLERAKMTEPEGYLIKPLKTNELNAVIQMVLHKYKQHSNSSGCTAELSQIEASSSEQSRAGEILLFLSSLKFFDELDTGELDLLSNSSKILDIKQGAYIYRDGQVDPPAFIVMEGRIGLVKEGRDGKEFIVELLPSGDLFGLLNVLERNPVALSARAQIGSRILEISKPVFLQFMESRPAMARRLSEQIVNRLKRSYEAAQAMAQQQVGVRVATALNSLLPKNNRGSVEYAESYCLRITRQEIADFTGAAVETVVRVTKDLERQGILQLGQRGKIVVTNREALEQICTN